MIAAYARLAEIAVAESQLVGDGRLDDLPPLWAERAEILSALPGVPPADARPHLEQAQAAVRGTQAALEARIAELGAELGELHRGRRAATAYGGHPRSGVLDTRG